MLQSRFESGEGKEVEEGVVEAEVQGGEEGGECWVIDQLIDPSLHVIVFHYLPKEKMVPGTKSSKWLERMETGMELDAYTAAKRYIYIGGLWKLTE